MTAPPDDPVRTGVAELNEAVQRATATMAQVLDDIAARLLRLADALDARPPVAAERIEPLSASQRRPGHPVTGGVMKRTAARRVRLQELWKVQPRVSLDDIAADLNAIQPGTDLERGDVSSWAHDLKLPRRIDRYAAPAETLAAPEQLPARPAITAPAAIVKPCPEPPQVTASPPAQPVATPAIPAKVAAASIPPVAPQSNYPKISGSSIAAQRRPVEALARATLAPSTDPVAADETYIRSWAAERGIYSGRQLNIAQINARRRHLGLPPFVDPADRPRARS